MGYMNFSNIIAQLVLLVFILSHAAFTASIGIFKLLVMLDHKDYK